MHAEMSGSQRWLEMRGGRVCGAYFLFSNWMEMPDPFNDLLDASDD